MDRFIQADAQGRIKDNKNERNRDGRVRVVAYNKKGNVKNVTTGRKNYVAERRDFFIAKRSNPAFDTIPQTFCKQLLRAFRK